MQTPRITRLHVIGALFALLVLFFGYSRVTGGGEADPVALPSLTEDADELDGFDDFDIEDESSDPSDDEPTDDEPTEEGLELTELDSDADESIFDVEDGPEASGVDPLTGRIDGEPVGDAAELVDEEPLDLDDSEDPEGPAAFVDQSNGNQIDTGLDGRNDAVVVVGDGIGDGDGVIVVDGTGDGDGNGVIVVDGNGDGDGNGVIVIDGDGDRNDSDIIVVDADGYSFADDDDDENDIVIIGGNGDGDGTADTVIIIDDDESEIPSLSSQPPDVTFDDAPADSAPAAPDTSVSMAEQANAAAAEALLNEWLVAKGVSGARIGISHPDGSRTYLTGGTENDGSELDVSAEFMATSVTKTMTAAVIFDLVSNGVFELDTPAPALGAVPDFGHAGAFTIRQLLQHTSGLAPYQRSPEWSQDMELNALTALQLADDVPLENTPGTDRGYSNSGYLYLGLLAEQYTGTPFHELINGRIVDPLGLEKTRIDGARRPGWVGYSAGGLISSVPDLLTWGSALYRDGSILDAEQLDSMLDVDNEHSTGLGANVICPCGVADGRLWYTSIGHDGGSVTLQHSPADDLIVSAKFTESFWTEDLTQRDVHRLLRELRAVLISG